MINPYTRSDRAIATDLKVFIGKRSEISVLEAQNKIVDKKWYLAWDTGEFFVANSLRKLVRYGGTANNLSKEDISNIIDEYTKEDLIMIKSQLRDALIKYNESIKNIKDIDNKVDKAVLELENNTTAYIIKKINEVIGSSESLTYSKIQIDEKIENAKQEVTQASDSKFISNEVLNNYATKTDLTNNLNYKLSFDTGNRIQSYLMQKQNGYYFCVANSTSENFEMGHTYYLNNGTFKDITAEGTGGSYVAPDIMLTIDGKSSVTYKILSNFNQKQIFTYSINNPKSIKGELSFYENKVKVKDISVKPELSGSFEYQTTLANLNVGKYLYTLSGEDKHGTQVLGTFTVNIIAPIYYGTTKNTKPNVESVKASNERLSENVAASYQFATSIGDYIFIAIPYNLTITKVSMQGFEVPMNPAEEIILNFGKYPIKYKYYSSKTQADSGLFNIDII